MEKVLIIQPHSDDAILCCSKFMLNSNDFSVRVLTVENNEKRINEDRAMAEFLGIKYSTLGVEVMDDYYSEFFKVHEKNVVLNDDNVIRFYNEKLGKDKIKEISSKLTKKVQSYIDKGYIILCPIGVGHPFHYLVRYTLRSIEDSFVFYREFPHSYKRKAQEQMNNELQMLEPLFSFDDKEVLELKYTIAQKFYKSQSGFFFYEQGNIKKLYAEEFYMKKEDASGKDAKIYVISKDRPDGRTFDFLHGGNVEYTVVVEPQDEAKYRAAGHKNILVLPENDRGFSYTVNYSKNQFDGKNPVIIMDDDILGLAINYSGTKHISHNLYSNEEFSSFFKELKREICNTDFDIGTIGKTAFDWYLTDVNPRISTHGSKYRYSGLPVVIIINSTDLLKFDFDESLCFKSDIDYSLKCMYLGLKYAKFVRFLQQTRMNKDGKQKGGLSETYKRADKLIASQNILLERWPDNIKTSEKKKSNNGVDELRVIYKISNNEPSVISEIRKLLKT